MNMLSAFAPEMNRTYSVFVKDTALDADDEVIEGYISIASLRNIKCAYFTGSAAESLISDRYKTTASGVIISKVVTIPDGAKIVLDNGLEFSVIHPDDVMFQGEVLVITVKAEDYGTEL